MGERETRTAADQHTSALIGIAAEALAVAVLVVGVAILMLNVIRIVRAREASAESEERFRLLVEGARDYALYMLDPEGNVASRNTGAKRIKGYTADKIIGRNFDCFFVPEEVQAGLPDQDLRTAAMGGRFEHEGWAIAWLKRQTPPLL